MNSCLIISGGDFSPANENLTYDYVIACDIGYIHCEKLGITPDLIMGDFDSFTDSSCSLPDNIPHMSFPIEKDDTDTMLAVKYALEQGFRHLIIICGLGGRLDHTLANIQTMAYAADRGAVCELYSENEYIRTFDGGSLSLPRRDNWSLSLFALTDACTNLSIKGAKYEISSAVLTNRFPLGVSNSWADDSVEITMDDGLLLVVESRLE